MADNIKIIDGGGTTSYVRAIGLAGGTYVPYSVPSRIDGTAYLAPTTIASSLPVALATDQVVSTLITNAFITSVLNTAYFTTGIPTSSNTALTVTISPNGLNANGSGTSAGAAPVVIANDQQALATIISTKNLANGNSTTLLTPLFKSLSMNTAGTSEIIASSASLRIRVIALHAIIQTATAFNWMSGAVGITGTANFTTNTGYVLPFNPVGWFETAAGSALVGNSSASSQIGGSITYVTLA
jgi:hypothetical protein